MLYPYFGYDAAAEPNPEILRVCRFLIREATSLSKPLYGYRLVEGEAIDRTTFRWDNQQFSPGAVITHALRGCAQYCFFTATVGHEFDAWLQQIHASGDILHLYVADAIGSALAELTSLWGYDALAQKMSCEELRMTNSYSPGYCDWHVSEQRLFFSLLPDSFCGIRLTDSCLMQPIKSISSVIGIDPHAVKRPYGCAICRRTDCFLKIARGNN